MERDVKLVFMLIGYFLFLTFVVTMTNAISTEFGLNTGYSESIGLSLDSVNTNNYAGGGRFKDIENDKQTAQSRNYDKTPRPYLQNGYITDEESCESYKGFTWTTTNVLIAWLPYVPSETCTGVLDFSYYDPDDTLGETSIGRYSQNPICDLPRLDVGDSTLGITAEQMTYQFGCEWFASGIQTQTALSGNSGFSYLIQGLKQIFTFDINFPIEDNFLRFIVNFIVVGFPLILLTMFSITLGRKLVGFS